MGRTLENKQQIVEELKGLLGEAEMALVLDFKGLTIKEMSDLRTRLQASNGICKVTKNTLIRRAIDGDAAGVGAGVGVGKAFVPFIGVVVDVANAAHDCILV